MDFHIQKVADRMDEKRGAGHFLQGKTRLRPVEGLDLAFFVQAQDQGLVRRIQIRADDIVQLLDEML